MSETKHLEYEELIKIMKDKLSGRPLTNHTPEAQKWWAELDKEIEYCRKNNKILWIPAEW